jgi:hypothetical protein
MTNNYSQPQLVFLKFSIFDTALNHLYLELLLLGFLVSMQVMGLYLVLTQLCDLHKLLLNLIVLHYSMKYILKPVVYPYR